MLTEFAFRTLKIDYITIWVYEGNKSVIALNKSYGYEWVENRIDEKGEPFRVGVLTRARGLERNEILKNKLRLNH